MIQSICHNCLNSLYSLRGAAVAYWRSEEENLFPLSIHPSMHPPTQGWFSLPHPSKCLFHWDYGGTIGNKCWQLHAVGFYSFEDGCDLSSSCIIAQELQHSPQREAVLGSTCTECELTSPTFNSEELNSSLRRMTIRKSPWFLVFYPFLFCLSVRTVNSVGHQKVCH